MNGPGDRALKPNDSGVPTLCVAAEGHGENQRDDGLSHTPGSWSSARSHSLSAREPGDLDAASSLSSSETPTREGDEPQAVAPIEESDAAVVPQTSTKTRVTPVESIEGRAAAKGKSVARVSPLIVAVSRDLVGLAMLG